MFILAKVIHCLFPLIALVLLIIGLKRKSIYYVISALWISLISLIIHFQYSGGQILGSYFNYINAGIYTINLIILCISLIAVLTHLSINSSIFKYFSSFASALIVIASLLVITNLWVNAYFIEHRMAGTPIMQVANLNKVEYCSYQYVFYTVALDGTVQYLCPNYYGFIPAMGHLTISPEFIANQLSLPVKKQMLLLQKKKT